MSYIVHTFFIEKEALGIVKYKQRLCELHSVNDGGVSLLKAGLAHMTDGET